MQERHKGCNGVILSYIKVRCEMRDWISRTPSAVSDSPSILVNIIGNIICIIKS